ncbi:MAG: hypothetical protein ACI9VR_004532 [Cognaticolwellia sp.]|jgi:uncharacterized protein (DUF427 family)
MSRTVTITHLPTGTPIARGPLGWGITPFEGNYYIRKKYMLTNAFRRSWWPGFCPYKFIYVWLDFAPEGHETSTWLGWMYILPNPLFPFIWFRTAVPGEHLELSVEVVEDYPS